MESDKPKWIRKQKHSEEFEIIRARKFHNLKDFQFDNGCYILLKTYKKTKEIGVAVCDYNHSILKEFRGKNAKDIYMTIFDYDIINKRKWFNRMDHAAYLGKELKKAEMSLKMGFDYEQE
jgi:tetrahydromethanopterin S-methyltransferase subunit A